MTKAILAAAILIIAIGAILVSSLDGPDRAATPAVRPELAAIDRQAPTAASRAKLCGRTIGDARRAGLLDEVRLNGNFAALTVGDAFPAISLEAKRGLAIAASCVVTAGDTSRCADLDFSDRRTGKTVARFAACRLDVM